MAKRSLDDDSVSFSYANLSDVLTTSFLCFKARGMPRDISNLLCMYIMDSVADETMVVSEGFDPRAGDFMCHENHRGRKFYLKGCRDCTGGTWFCFHEFLNVRCPNPWKDTEVCSKCWEKVIRNNQDDYYY